MAHKLYVFGDHAYEGKKALRDGAGVKPRKAAKLRSLDGPAAIVYRLHFADKGRVRALDQYYTDPVDVHFAAKRHPGCTVTTLPVER